jgi:ribosome-binding factor A
MARRSADRGFSRTDRLSESIREIVATELERLDDDRLDLVTVTSVSVDNDLAHAAVYYSALVADQQGRGDAVADALADQRWRIQRVVNRNVRARKTPQIEFRPDDVLRQALRLDDILEGRTQVPTTDDPDERNPHDNNPDQDTAT